MKPQTSGMSRAHKANNTQIEGPNWLIFAAGALLSTLSIRLGYKLKQAVDSKPKQNATTGQKGPYVLFGGHHSPPSAFNFFILSGKINST